MKNDYSLIVPNYVKSFMNEPNLEVSEFFKIRYEGQYEFVGHYVTPVPHLGTTIQELTQDKLVDGRWSHRAWITGVNEVVQGQNTNHRGYPTLQMEKTPIGIIQDLALVDLYVWLDFPLEPKEHKNWFSLATFTSYYDNYWARSYLLNLDEKYQLHLMHVPVQGVTKPDIFQSKNIILPRKSWVRVTILLDYTSSNRFNNPIMVAWQNGELVSASTFNNRIDPYTTSDQRPACLDDWDGVSVESAESACALNFTGGLAQTHFGLYAPPLLDEGLMYNDALNISRLRRT